MDRHGGYKQALAPLRAAMADFSESGVRRALSDVLASDAAVHLAHPLCDLAGPEIFYDKAYAPLLRAVPDLERRDTIVMSGSTKEGADWVGCCGYYTGVFAEPWLDIPATGHQVSLRFHEFFRMEDGRAVEIQAIWDIPELMMQSNAWPLAPSLGREWHVPGPSSQDGIVSAPRDEERSSESMQLVLDMLTAMQRHPAQGGPELMEMERYWHPRMNWYGPSGIGTARGVRGFRNWHQIPFLSAMPDRGRRRDAITPHFFGDGNYAAVTGWPDMRQTLSDGGWMGIAPAGRKIELRSLDFWRIEDRLIRENWVLIDLLHVYHQLGVDVLARMREFNKARGGARFSPETGAALK